MDSSVREGSVPAPDPDVAADMMLAAEVALAAAGMPRYEVANYAQPGFESRHNTVYWTGGAYLGVGPHASSMLPYADLARIAEGEGWTLATDGDLPARARMSREVTLAEYLRAPLAMPAPIELLTREQAAREDVMLGMRLTRGVDAAQVEGAGLTSVLRELAASGLVTREADADGTPRWRTTQQGWLLGNRVFGAIWNGK
jgi:oxygen-independent coproporphyrinogen-3 oxidase